MRSQKFKKFGVKCSGLALISLLFFCVLTNMATVKIRISKWKRSDDGRRQDDRIFFHETTGRKDLDLRQLCAVESAAHENPGRPVQLFLQTEAMSVSNSSTLRVLGHYPNVEVILLANVTEYFLNTPLENWYIGGQWRHSPYRNEHFSDYIRVLSLSKGGGMYLDMDFVTLKSFDREIFWNFVPTEDTVNPTGSALHLEQDHPMIGQMLKELALSYHPKEWSHHGPLLVRRILEKNCRFQRNSKFVCPNLKILPHHYLYPYPYHRWEEYFKNRKHPALPVDEFAHTYAMHVWNKLSKNWPVFVNSNQIYSMAAALHCPLTYASATVSF